jgi:hypothetical protein
MSPDGGFSGLRSDDRTQDDGLFNKVGASIVEPEVEPEPKEEAAVVPLRDNSLAELDERLPDQAKPEKLAEAKKPSPRARPSRDPGSVVTLTLGNDLLNRARASVRRYRTGGERALGGAFVVHSYIEAVDEILKKTEIDTYGIERGDQKEMTKRVKQALTEALAAEK